jgi:hypothetical protein
MLLLRLNQFHNPARSAPASALRSPCISPPILPWSIPRLPCKRKYKKIRHRFENHLISSSCFKWAVNVSQLPSLKRFQSPEPGRWAFYRPSILLSICVDLISIFGAINSITFRFTIALLLPKRTDGSESRHGMRINLSLKRKGSTYMSGNRQPTICHPIILKFGLMIHLVPAMMFAANSAAWNKDHPYHFSCKRQPSLAERKSNTGNNLTPLWQRHSMPLEGSRDILGLITIRFNITIVNDDDWEPLSNGEYEYQDSGTNIVEIVRLHCSWIVGGDYAWESHDNRSLWWWCAAANLRCLVVRLHDCRKFRWANWEVGRGFPGVMVLKRSGWLFVDIETFMKLIWRPRKLYAKRGKGDLKFAGVEDSHGDEVIKVNQDSV